MAHGSTGFKLGAAFAALGMAISSTAHAAPSNLGGVDPLVSLSVFGTSSSRAAICDAGTAAASTAATARTGASCLPMVAAASAAAAAAQDPNQQDPNAAYVPVAEPRPMIEALALPLGVFAVGVLLILLLDDDDDDDDDDDVSPD